MASDIDRWATVRIVGRAISGIILITGALGCANPGIPLAPQVMPSAKAATPLPGALTVMLPYDERPAVERQGGQPGLESFVYLVFVEFDTERGSYVTSDSDFGLPYPEKVAASYFGARPVVTAAVGEGVVSCIANAGLFERVARLRPPDRRETWELADKAARPVRLFSGPPELANLTGPEQEAQDLQLRGMATPLPSFSSEWLLRVHVLHLYASQFATNVDVIVATSNSSTSASSLRAYAPSGNAVLSFELYHQSKGNTTLVWNRTVAGTVTSAGTVPAGKINGFAVTAFTDALDKMTTGLVHDAPLILAQIQSDAPSVAAAKPLGD
jgi:hypothetical protein